MSKYGLGCRLVALLLSIIILLVLFQQQIESDSASSHCEKNETEQDLSNDHLYQPYQCPTIDKLFNCPAVRGQDGFICRECISSWPASGTITARTERNASASGETQIYMNLLVPPGWGSSMLLNLISSSPAVSNMCKVNEFRKMPWQCESFSFLRDAGLMTIQQKWDADFKLNLSTYHQYYHEHKVWVDMEAPILLEKSPFHISRVPELLEFYESEDINYRFVVMARHPCRKRYKAKHYQFLQDVLDLIPLERRFLLDYDELTFNPELAAQGLLEWLPELQQLTLGSNNMKNIKRSKETTRKKCGGTNTTRERRMLHNKERRHRRSMLGMHASSLADFMFSDSCGVCLSPHAVDGKAMQLWAKFKEETDSQSF